MVNSHKLSLMKACLLYSILEYSSAVYCDRAHAMLQLSIFPTPQASRKFGEGGLVVMSAPNQPTALINAAMHLWQLFRGPAEGTPYVYVGILT
jgi:hypothetical protein